VDTDAAAAVVVVEFEEGRGGFRFGSTISFWNQQTQGVSSHVVTATVLRDWDNDHRDFDEQQNEPTLGTFTTPYRYQQMVV
jgi:hypothetical protein